MHCNVSAAQMLYHVSEEAGIRRFEPRPSEYTDEPVVWAVDAERLRNYLLPRDCPRVTFYAGPETTAVDRERHLGQSPAVVAIEEGWVDRVACCRLYGYRMPPQTFACLDECAGYFVSREGVTPVSVQIYEDAISELRRRGVELRVLSNLWPLRDAIVESTLQFSMIRMRNALPRAIPPADQADSPEKS